MEQNPAQVYRGRLAILHLAISMFNSSIIFYYKIHVQWDKMVPLPEGSGGFDNYRPFLMRFMDLSNTCYNIQGIYFSLAFTNDVTGTNVHYPPSDKYMVRAMKDLLFAIQFPIVFYVSFCFWGIYFYDKNLILPDHAENVFPFWLNHMMHTLIVPIVILELFLTPKDYPPTFVGIPSFLIIFMGSVYMLCSAFLNSGTMTAFTDMFEGMMPKLLFIYLNILFGICFYAVGQLSNQYLHYRGLRRPPEATNSPPKRPRRGNRPRNNDTSSADSNAPPPTSSARRRNVRT